MSTIRKFVLYAVYALVVIGLGLVIFFAFIHHSKPKAPIVQAPSGSQQVSHNPVISPSTKPLPKGTTSTPSPVTVGDTAKNAIASATATPPAATAPTSTGTLTNTGPGSIWAIFAGSSLLAALAYRLRLLRRLI
jgi:hypothetical protein